MNSKNKKICIIRSNSVSPDSRVEKEAWTLLKAGYDVHILSWDRTSDIYEVNTFITVGGERIPITRLGHRATFGEGFKNIRAYLCFQFHMRKWLIKNIFDVIHACDFDTAFFSLGIAKRKKVKFIFDIFDFLFGDPQNYFQKCVKRAQLKIIDKADGIVICTEERINQIKGSTPKCCVVIHNTPASSHISDVQHNVISGDKVRLVYVGILQDYRLLKEVAEVVSESDDLELHIGGFGKYDEYFTHMPESYSNIIFYGRLDYERTLALENACDIMLAIYDPSIENHRYAAPNKFYESLFLGKPVIMAQNTGMSQIVYDKELGEVIEYSKEGFEKGVRLLMAKRNKWNDIECNAKELYRTQFDWAEMEKRLLKLYDKVLITE